MREHIDRISKHIERIKEIIGNDIEILDSNTSNMSESEIHKMSEVGKATNAIENYNLIDEYSKFKKINNYIRISYFAIVGLIIGFIILISADYIQVKIENNNVSQIIQQKTDLEKKLSLMQETIDQTKDKNNEIVTLLTQKENKIKELNKELEEVKNIKDINYRKTDTNKSIDESDIKEEENTNLGEDKTTCKAQTSITVNLRESAGLNSNIISILKEGTNVEVIKKQYLDGREWYQIKTSEKTGWIANIGIEGFDNTCLKK